MIWEDWLNYLEKRYGTCEECGKKMRHEKETHTFVCSCGNRDWYAERFGDKDLLRVNPEPEKKGEER